jgi:hypothetical protein
VTRTPLNEKYPSLYIQGGAPNYYHAAFIAHDFMTDQKGSSPGWRRICAPIGPLDSSGNLPSNKFGYWQMKSPLDILSGSQGSGLPASANSTWPTLQFDVTAIVLPVDFTGNPAERVGYDNICMKADSSYSSTSGVGNSQGQQCGITGSSSPSVSPTTFSPNKLQSASPSVPPSKPPTDSPSASPSRSPTID